MRDELLLTNARPRLQYLKQVARNTGADSYPANEENGLQQIQMESCQPIKRLRDKKKKKTSTLFLSTGHQKIRENRVLTCTYKT